MEEEETEAEAEEEEEEGGEEKDGRDGPSPEQAPLSSASSLPPRDEVENEHSQAELELRVLEALEIYSPSRLKGMHRHFVLFGLMEYLQKSFDRQFSADEVLQLLDRFFNLDMLIPDDEGICLFNQEEEFSLPQIFFVKDEQ